MIPEYAIWPDNLSDTRFMPSMVKYFDKIVGQIEKKLITRGIADNTIFVLVTDNGTDQKIVSKFKGQNIKGGKTRTNEWGTHLPLIISWPRTIQSSTNENLIDFVDFMPTFADIAQSTDNFETDGISFYQQLFNSNISGRPYGFCWYDVNRFGDDGKPPIIYSYDTNYKLYDQANLYKYVTDPNEKKPVVNNQENKLLQSVIRYYTLKPH